MQISQKHQKVISGHSICKSLIFEQSGHVQSIQHMEQNIKISCEYTNRNYRMIDSMLTCNVQNINLLTTHFFKTMNLKMYKI